MGAEICSFALEETSNAEEMCDWQAVRQQDAGATIWQARAIHGRKYAELGPGEWKYKRRIILMGRNVHVGIGGRAFRARSDWCDAPVYMATVRTDFAVATLRNWVGGA